MSKYLDNDGLLYLWQKLKALFAQKSDVGHTHAAADVTSGTFDSARIPTASANALGGIKVGTNLSIDANGVLSADAQPVIPMTGASASAAGTAGTVPAPAAGQEMAVLRGDGEWGDLGLDATRSYDTGDFLVRLTSTDSRNESAVLDDVTIPMATTLLSGLMSSADKTKLDGIETGAQVNTITGVKGNTESSYRTGNVNITAANVGAAESTHTHGNIQNGGTLQNTDITIANGDKLVVTDSSDSGKIARTSIEFDGSTATKALTQKGTWETFLQSDEKVKVSNNSTDGSYYLLAAGVLSSMYSSGGSYTANIPTTSSNRPRVNMSTGKLTAASFSGVGTNLTQLNASNLTSGTVNASLLPAATQSAQGAMSAADKTKLDAFGDASTYALKSDITSMYKHKGSVATTNALPSSGNTTGDVYNVTATGMNYVWVEDGGTGSWDALGEVFSIDSITNAEIDTILAA